LNLSLILLARCNASCAHCSESYGPYRREALAREEILSLMNQAAAIDDGQPLQFALTGGEPFLDFELLRDVVAAALGGVVSCVTNAFWAKTPEIANARLAELQSVGLTVLAVSASRFHQQYVPLQRVRYALQAAGQLGITTELKGAITLSDLQEGGVLETWKQTLNADRINMFPVLSQLRRGEALPEDEYYREGGLPPHPCPGAAVCVDHDGVATCCCVPGSNEPFLTIGNTRSMSLADIHRNFTEHKRQKILREHGPIHFAVGAIAAGLASRLRSKYAGPCDLCLHLRTDPELRRIAEEMSNP
jgi:hypothetical protein